MMGVIPYFSNPEAAKAVAWAYMTAIYSDAVPSTHATTDQETLDDIKRLGVELDAEACGGCLYVTFGPVHAVQAAQVILVANAATYAERYAEKVDLEEVADQVAKAVQGWAPPKEAMERVREDGLPYPETRLAWSILSRVEYNVYPSVVLGDFALALLRRLKEAPANRVMSVETGLEPRLGKEEKGKAGAEGAERG